MKTNPTHPPCKTKVWKGGGISTKCSSSHAGFRKAALVQQWPVKAISVRSLVKSPVGPLWETTNELYLMSYSTECGASPVDTAAASLLSFCMCVRVRQRVGVTGRRGLQGPDSDLQAGMAGVASALPAEVIPGHGCFFIHNPRSLTSLIGFW